jgi:S1-C subfamily serine protease
MCKILNSRIVIFLICLFSGINAKSQIFEIKVYQHFDSVFFNSELVSVIKKVEPKYICLYQNQDIRYEKLDHINRYLDSIYPKVKRKHKVDKFLGLPPTVVFENHIFINNINVGNILLGNDEYFIPTYFVTVTKIGLSSLQFEKIQFDIKTKYKKENNRSFNVFVNTDYSLEFQKIKEEEERRAKQKISNFYDYVFSALNNNLENIEGVYKSIDQGERFNYDIVILKSRVNPLIFESFVLKSTDSNLEIGNPLFSLTKTAEDDKFVMQYLLKNGDRFENKLAIYSGGVLNSGIKSFVKMFPSKGDNKQYSKIDPLVDWDVSGSGILLNDLGYIATNYHVIKNANKLLIKISDTLNQTYEYRAKLISKNETDDIAILRIDDKEFNFIAKKIHTIKLSSKVNYGLDVFTLGFPSPTKLGENIKLNKGIISATTEVNKMCYFQTDLPVWYGNSGGPVYNLYGELVGLVTRIKFDDKQKIENVCYVLRSDCINKLFNDELKSTNKIDDFNKSEKTELQLTDLVNSLIINSVFIKVYTE